MLEIIGWTSAIALATLGAGILQNLLLHRRAAVTSVDPTCLTPKTCPAPRGLRLDPEEWSVDASATTSPRRSRVAPSRAR